MINPSDVLVVTTKTSLRGAKLLQFCTLVRLTLNSEPVAGILMAIFLPATLQLVLTELTVHPTLPRLTTLGTVMSIKQADEQLTTLEMLKVYITQALLVLDDGVMMMLLIFLTTNVTLVVMLLLSSTAQPLLKAVSPKLVYPLVELGFVMFCSTMDSVVLVGYVLLSVMLTVLLDVVQKTDQLLIRMVERWVVWTSLGNAMLIIELFGSQQPLRYVMVQVVVYETVEFTTERVQLDIVAALARNLRQVLVAVSCVSLQQLVMVKLEVGASLLGAVMLMMDMVRVVLTTSAVKLLIVAWELAIQHFANMPLESVAEQVVLESVNYGGILTTMLPQLTLSIQLDLTVMVRLVTVSIVLVKSAGSNEATRQLGVVVSVALPVLNRDPARQRDMLKAFNVVAYGNDVMPGPLMNNVPESLTNICCVLLNRVYLCDLRPDAVIALPPYIVLRVVPPALNDTDKLLILPYWIIVSLWRSVKLMTSPSASKSVRLYENCGVMAVETLNIDTLYDDMVALVALGGQMVQLLHVSMVYYLMPSRQTDMMLMLYSTSVVGGVTNESMVKLTRPEYYLVDIQMIEGQGNYWQSQKTVYVLFLQVSEVVLTILQLLTVFDQVVGILKQMLPFSRLLPVWNDKFTMLGFLSLSF